MEKRKKYAKKNVIINEQKINKIKRFQRTFPFLFFRVNIFRKKSILKI
jgi:U3 small nucleolar RNA-associated protein 14